MGGSAAGDGDLEDDSVELPAAAECDEILAAKLLIHLSRSGEPVSSPTEPPRPLLQQLLKQEPAWARKGSRSRTITMEGILAAEKEEARQTSPTTPLSWSGGGSGTSGSVCSGRPPQGRKRPRGNEDGDSKKGVPETMAGGEQIRAPPAGRAKPEPYQSGGPAPTALGSSATAGPNKMVPVAAAVREVAFSSPVAVLEPLRLRSTVEVTGPVVNGRPEKKKALAELQAMRESLLQEQEGLLKEFERQKVMYNALLEENVRLKKLELILSSHVDSRPSPTHAACEEANLEHVQSIPESQTVKGSCTAPFAPEEEESPAEPQCTTAPGRMFLFDLNCLPDDDL